MFLASILTLLQTETRFNQPTYFLPVVLLMLAAGLVLWLVAAVLGFARARAFGPSTRWFAIAAVCMIIYHLQFLLIALELQLHVHAVVGIGGDHCNLEHSSRRRANEIHSSSI